MIRDLKHVMMHRSRGKKLREMLSLLPFPEPVRILDVGPADEEYSPFDNYFEKQYLYAEHITVLSIHPLTAFKKKYPRIRAVQYSGEIFPFRSRHFSMVLSNAVIEHIGEFPKQVSFVKEMKRVGKQFDLTTPAKEFPWEIHTNLPVIHWLPKRFLVRFLFIFGKGWTAGDYVNLLSRKRLSHLFQCAEVAFFRVRIHWFGPFPLHYSVWGK